MVLIDGSSYLFRAFHALPPLTNSQGEPTGAIHGVLNMLTKLIRETEPEHIAFVFDASGKTFRDDIYPEYKANRPPMPDDLRSQIKPLLAIIEAMGLPLLIVPDVEADDVIGTLAVEAAKAGMSCLVSTSDKDMAQLVNDKVTLVNTMSGTVMDRDGVMKKFAVWPEQIIDWLALVGDSVDNIPGVPKVGAKTAAKWLAQYESVDNIIEKADEITGKVGESLRENIEQLKLSRTLATIACDVKLDVKPAELRPGEPDNKTLRDLYQKLELRTLLRNLEEQQAAPADEIPASDEPETNYECVLTKKDFARWKKAIGSAALTALDTETNSLDYMSAELVGISLAVEPGHACYIPVAHNYPGAPDQLDCNWVLNELRPFLEDDGRAKVGHHLKYDAHIFARYGIALKGMRYDSMLQSYVLNSTATRHDMDSVTRHYLGRETIHYEDVAGKGAKQITFDQVSLDIATPYAAEDADITLSLQQHLAAELAAVPALEQVYETIEQPLVPVLLDM